MLLIAFSACEKEPTFEEQSQNETEQTAGRFSGNPILADFENGRLVFENQEAFDQTIASLKNIEETDLPQIFDDYYDSGFVPLYPYYEEEETDRIADFLQKKKGLTPSKFKDLEMEFDDILISDDLFASLLNYKREIILDGKIIKYTFSGALIADESDSLALKTYVDRNNINELVPDPMTLSSELNPVTSEIDVYVSPKVAFPPDCFTTPQPTDFPNPISDIICDGVPSTGGTGYEPPAPTYTNALINYVDSLLPCNYDDAAALDGFTPFGTRKVCFEGFPGSRRTKTLYSNEDYLFYTAVAVKVKHQRRHVIDLPWPFGSIVWYATKKTDEVALIINQACFRISAANIQAPLFEPPTNSENKMLFYIGDYVYNDSYYGPTIEYNAPSPPSTPFDEDVIVQFYNDNIAWNQNMEITAENVSNLFWNTVYDKAVDIFRSQQGHDPTKLTLLLNTPTSTIVQYVDLSQRKLNTKKIKDVLDYDWGFTIGFSINLDGNGNPITDPSQLYNANHYNIGIPNLTEFEDVYMDFVGVTRRGSTWKGSRMVYKATGN